MNESQAGDHPDSEHLHRALDELECVVFELKQYEEESMTKEQADIVIALLKEIRDHMAIMSAAAKANTAKTR